MAMNWNTLLSCMLPSFGRGWTVRLWSRHGVPSTPRRRGLSVWCLLTFVGVQETLQAQVVIPLDCELFVLLVECGQRDVLTTDKITAPLLNTQVVVTKVEGIEKRFTT